MNTISLRSLRTPALLLVALASGSAAAQVASPTPSAPAVHGKLRAARLDADPITWSDASRQLVLPVGARVDLEYTLDQPHLVSWEGAWLTGLDNFSSHAEFVAGQEGSELVRLVASDPAGPALERLYVNVQVLQPVEFAELLADGEVTESGVLVERDDVDGGDARSASASWHFGSLFHGLVPWLRVNGPYGGSSSGGGPVDPGLLCADSCSIDINQVNYNGNYTWDVQFTITNHATCKTSFKIFGSTGGGESSWSAPILPLHTVSLPTSGWQKYWITVSYADADWSSLPWGYMYFKLYAIGSHTFTVTTGGPSFNCSKDAVALCFGGCNNP